MTCSLELIFLSLKTIIIEIHNIDSLLDQILLCIKEKYNPIIDFINISFIDDNITYNISNYNNDDNDNLEKLSKIILENTYYSINIIILNITKINYLYKNEKYNFAIENSDFRLETDKINHIEFYEKFIKHILEFHIENKDYVGFIDIKLYNTDTNELLYLAYYYINEEQDLYLDENKIINRKYNIYSIEFKVHINIVPNDMDMNYYEYEIYNENEYNRMY